MTRTRLSSLIKRVTDIRFRIEREKSRRSPDSLLLVRLKGLLLRLQLRLAQTLVPEQHVPQSVPVYARSPYALRSLSDRRNR